MQKINEILEKAPAIISERAELENACYAEMIKLHETYKREWAKKFLSLKATTDNSIKEIEATLEIDEELIKIKDLELTKEVDYRAWKARKDKAINMFDMAKQMGFNLRCEQRNLDNIIKE